MVSPSYFPIQDLPVELEREIFETAARMRPPSALDLVLVARRVRDWIQPLIYELVTLGDYDGPLFLRTMDELPAPFFATSVKKLCLTISIDSRDAVRILSVCTGVDGLALWVNFWRGQNTIPLAPLVRSLPLRKLSIPLKFFLEISQDHTCRATLFPRIDHLDLTYWEWSDTPQVPQLTLLPNLAYLGIRIHSGLSREYLLALSSQCASLRVLSVLVDDDVEFVPTEDPRIVFSLYPDAITLDWAASMRGLESTWTAAELVVQQRLAEIASSPSNPSGNLWTS